ncbi:NAD(P)H dehydrogenase (quinone) [Roseateles sp. YR242]|uniref:NAD(P)H-dependent oxidoreductase n=1 Tax=Roseateles sp. YR242 TaxID=1855305 RepID=UPI0008BDEEE4|nr:NAD(P)H-dependent oxidoreductase [Roseateles sp. YR242]SEL07167.1 NAD(P)H dehydrogenase (quinone) [Roseateles sp. YR242]
MTIPSTHSTPSTPSNPSNSSIPLPRRRRILIVHAQPEPTSLTRSMVDTARQAFEAQGHEVMASDLYAMQWKAVYDEQDFPQRLDPTRLSFVAESGHAYGGGTQPPEVVEEQRKLLAADLVILQFPLWWFGMPAIMKGWIDRVWAYGLAYGYRGAGNRHRYGEGGLHGRRALLSVTTGGPAQDYGPRGINGPLDQLLFPITHGTLFYPGMEVLRTHAVHGAGRMDAAAVQDTLATWAQRLNGVFEETPIGYRPQNGGDFDERRHALQAHVAPGVEGFAAHLLPPSPAGELHLMEG